MKNTIIKFGSYSCLLLLILFGISFLFEDLMDFSTSEIFGYTTIVLSLSFVYFGVKHFRDKENEGIVSFGKALKIGLLITLITSVTFGAINVVYTEVINPEFMTEYYNYTIEKHKENLPAEEFETRRAALESEKDLFANPLINFTLMAFTVFSIGLIVSLISALILQRKKETL